MISRVLVNGKRFYSIPGVREYYPSVTTVLGMINKPALGAWQQRVLIDSLRSSWEKKPSFSSAAEEKTWLNNSLAEANKKPAEVLDSAANFGTTAHQFIDDHLMKELPPLTSIPEDIRPVIQGFESWRKQSQLYFIRKDTVVYSHTFKYAGSFDALAKKTADQSLVVIDWKTSNRIYSEYAYQVAAYAHALEEITGQRVSEAWIVRFDKEKPLFEVKKVKDLDECFQVFLSALTIFRHHHLSPWTDGSPNEEFDADDVSVETAAPFLSFPDEMSTNPY